MADPDAGKVIVGEIIKEFDAFCTARGKASESDTRAKVITKVLTNALGWPEGEIDREGTNEAGRYDYRLKVNGKFHVVVEAKPEGDTFTIPVDGNRKTYAIDGALMTDAPTKAVMFQVRSYCDEEGIRYAVATNGDAWIVFRAIREETGGWKKGHARVFPSLQHIQDHFTEFWNLLSYDRICAGSLNTEFSSSLRASRQLHRVIANLFNAELPLRRNRLNTDLQPLVKLVFEDIADQEELDVLHNCYIHTGTLRTVANDLDTVITEAIPRFLADEGAKSVGLDNARGGFLRSIKESVNITKGELFLLLGGIGSGKSTFLKRYQRTTGKQLLAEKTMWFVADFIKPPSLAEMESFVWKAVLQNVRGRYKDLDCERRKNVKEVFQGEIDALHSTILSGLKPGTHKYEDALSEYLSDWQKDLSLYVPGIVKLACTAHKLKPILFIDNVDQLDPEYQAQIFLLAQRVTGLLQSVTVIALREESYYTANVQKTFTAYSTRKFHIASPHFRNMIGNRIQYALRRLENLRGNEEISPSEEHKRQSINDFLTVVQGGVVSNERIGKLIKSLCYGNMRFALEMFCTFITSGAIDVDKILKIYWRDGWYNIAYHEFVKSVMLRDRAYYKEEQSPICNIFNVGSEPNASHFTSWRIIRSLMAHRGLSTPEGNGFIEVSKLYVEFETVFDNVEDFLSSINRLVRRHLVEPNTRSTMKIDGASHVRVTSAGWYYIRHLVPTFAYLDLVLQDTPLDNSGLEKRLRDSVHAVNNMPDDEEHKWERVQTRFERVTLFLEYLQQEENTERIEFNLDKSDSPLAAPIMSEIKGTFESERAWIERRIRENRERYREEYEAAFYEEEEAILGLSDVREEDAEEPDKPPQTSNPSSE